MRFFAFLLALLTLVAAGCTRELAPPLVEVFEVQPRTAEPGDRGEIRGAGFPQGRPTRLRFRGTVRRAGESPETVDIETTGNTVHADRIEIVWNELLVERFTGRGDRAAHATFEGELDVSFASSVRSAQALVGTLHAVSLDVRPSSIPAVIAEARTNEGTRILEFLGVVPGAATPRGIPVEEVKRGSIAEGAGVMTGDLVSSFDGVHVETLMDVAATSSRSATIGLRHGDIVEEDVRTVPLAGYASERIPLEYVSALLVVGFALALLLVLLRPGPMWLAVMEARIATRLRGASVSSLSAALFGQRRAASVSAVATILVASFALAPHIFGRELDGIVLLVASVVLLVASRAMNAAALRGKARVLLDLVPVVLLFAVVAAAMVALGGAMDLGEVVRGQGGAPWRFAAMQKPAAAVLAFVHASTVVSVLRVRGNAIVERVGLVATSALAVAVFFGGWRVPGVATTGSIGIQMLGGMLFVVKTWVLAAILLGVARVASAMSTREVRSYALRRLVPGAAIGLALVALSRKLAPSTAFETACGGTAVALVVLVALRCAARVRSVLGRPPAHASPFL